MARLHYKLGQDGPRKAHGSWYRGPHCNFVPSRANLQEPDAIDRYILSGWAPERPPISKQDAVLTFGSCFAKEVKTRLRARGFNVTGRIATQHIPVVRQGAGINNTFAVRQQFEWALEGLTPSEDLWFDGDRRKICGVGTEAHEADRRLTRDVFVGTDVFIITLGLSEVWFNKRTGEVFWRAIPKEVFDPQVHGFKVSSVAENTDNLKAIHQLIRRHVPHATIVFTLSPVPLVATFRPVSCVTANAVSKAVLRVALDNLMGETADERLFYWPSYEIVKEFFPQPYEEDNRHVRPEVVESIMDKFEQYFLADAAALSAK
jgi:hypothetical protein